MVMNTKRWAKKALAYMLIMACYFEAGIMLKSTWAEILGAIVGVDIALFIAEISLFGTTLSLLLISVLFPLYVMFSINSAMGFPKPLMQIFTSVPAYALLGPLVAGIFTFLLGRHLTNHPSRDE